MKLTFSTPAAPGVEKQCEEPSGGSDGQLTAPAAPELNRGGQGVVTLGTWGNTPCAIKTVHVTHAAAAGVEIATVRAV